MQINRVRKQKAKTRWGIFTFQKALKLIGDKWIGGVCWGEEEEKTRLQSEKHLSRAEGRTCAIISWPWDSQIRSHSKGQIKLLMVLCALYGSQNKILQEKVFYTNSVTPLVDEPHFSGIQICGDFLPEQSRAAKSSHQKSQDQVTFFHL